MDFFFQSFSGYAQEIVVALHRDHIIYWDSKLLAFVFYFAELVHGLFGQINIRCGRVMADNIAYAKFRKTLLI